jgi:phospholipase/carboxylesterase
MLETIEFYSSEHPPKASVIWMHGLGADGYDFANFVPELQLSPQLPVRFVFPHAPLRSISFNSGAITRAWYDIHALDPDAREDEAGLRETQKQIAELIEQEHLRGIPRNRIILGGFSQGGAVALYTGLRYSVPLGGIIALSSYLPLANKFPSEANLANHNTPIFIGHGTLDPIVPFSWGKAVAELLTDADYPVEWRSYDMLHQLCYPEVVDIRQWIEKQLLS